MLCYTPLPRPLQLPVGPDYRLSAAAVRRALSANTVLVVASSPGFPHGVMDHVEDIARVGLCCACCPTRAHSQ